MGIRFIYGKAGMGKSSFCIREIDKSISENKERKIIYLVPEQYTFQRESLILKVVGEKALLNTEILSFKTLARKIFNCCGGRNKIAMKESGKRMLVHKILHENQEDLNYFNKLSKESGFIDIICKVITEFKKYNIDDQVINNSLENIKDKELKDKLKDLSIVYNKYNLNIGEGFIDGDDELTLAYKYLKGDNLLFKDFEIWIDEFTTFTPQQLKILQLLAKKAFRVNIVLGMPKENISREIEGLFYPIGKTENIILRLMKENNIGYENPIELEDIKNSRYKNNYEMNYLQNHIYENPKETYKEEVNNIRLIKRNNSFEEIHGVAKDIIDLVRDKEYRFKDISVVCRDIESYEKLIKVIFNEYEIPYFMDKKQQILTNPLVVLILSALEIKITNWKYESVFKYLKNGFINIDKEEVDKLENYILGRGIKGKKWTSAIEVIEDDQERELKELMIKVREPLINFHNKIKDKTKVRDIVVAIYELLVELNCYKTLDSWIERFEEANIQDKAIEYSQIWDIILEILDQGVEVIGDQLLEVKEFYKILTSGFQNREIGIIPVALDQVNIGDIARIKGREVKVLFIIGVNDGVLPSSTRDEGILSDRDRELLNNEGFKLASTTRDKLFEEQYLVYTAISIPSDKLIVSYPMGDFEGKSLRPSSIISSVKKIFPYIKEESDINKKENFYERISAPIPTYNELILNLRKSYDNEDIDVRWKDVYSWFLEKEDFKNKSGKILEGLKYTNKSKGVSRKILKDLYSFKDGRLVFSVSRLERFAQCPFSYYVQYGLKAKDREMYELSAPDLGTFMHEIMDSFSKKVCSENISWSELTKNRCDEIVSELIDKKLKGDEKNILNSSHRYKYFAKRFNRIISKSVEVLSEQMKKGSFEIFSNEFEFGGLKDSGPIKIKIPSGEDIYLKGRIDRIDKLDLDENTYIRIVDYKSGNKEFDLNEVYYGLQIQLLVYLDAILKNSEYILKHQCMPGAILYFRIDDPILKGKKDMSLDEIKEGVLKKLKMNGLLLKDAEVVKSMDNDMEGYSLVIPAAFNKDGNFSSKSSVVTLEEFNILREYVNKKMIQICVDMLSGDIKIEPCKKDKIAFCEYCNFGSICQFDTTIDDNKYKVLVKNDEEDLWDKMKGEC